MIQLYYQKEIPAACRINHTAVHKNYQAQSSAVQGIFAKETATMATLLLLLLLDGYH